MLTLDVVTIGSAGPALPLGAADATGALPVVLVGLVALAALGFGLFRSGRRSKEAAADPVPQPAEPRRRAGLSADRQRTALPVPADRRARPLGTDSEGPVARICEGLYRWLGECEEQPDLWASFDQLVRELLGEHLGAARVRCFHIYPGCDTLAPIAQRSHGTTAPLKGPSTREGVLGHVVTTGREFVASGATAGALLENLAAVGEDSWEWVWPIRAAGESEAPAAPAVERPPLSGSVVGVMAVAHLHDAARLAPTLRQTVGRLLSMAWHQVGGLDRLRVLRRTDPASGVLTRHDFFTLATHALADSYRENEPVVVAVLALEGLRRLDDTGQWRQRDALIEQLGPVIARRVRSDDLVGRFADDRFVLLLRRLDSALGRLIAEKVLAAAAQTVATLDGAQSPVRLRVGLAGSGLRKPALDELLVGAFHAVEEARAAGVAIGTDLPAAAEAGTRE